MKNPNEFLPIRGMRAGKLPSFYVAARTLLLLTIYGGRIPPEIRRKGIDTSHWEPNFDFQMAYNGNARFAYMKASQGYNIPDLEFEISREHITGIMPWGPYHFVTSAPGIDQANFFYQCIADNPGVLPAVLDVEWNRLLASILKAIILRFHEIFGYWPLIYTSAYYWGLVVDDIPGTKAWISERCGLWVAHWGTDNPILPAGWTEYKIHQYIGDTGDELIPNVDLNYTRIAWLEQYAQPPQDWHEAVDAYLRTLVPPYTGPRPG